MCYWLKLDRRNDDPRGWEAVFYEKWWEARHDKEIHERYHGHTATIIEANTCEIDGCEEYPEWGATACEAHV